MRLLLTCLLVFSAARAAAPDTQEPAVASPAAAFSPTYECLIELLLRDGFDLAYLTAIYTDPRTHFLPDVLLINLTGKYRDADYSRFTSSSSVRHARQFLAEESAYLNRVETLFEVDREVIVSILYIESAFGKNAGNNVVLNVFSTLALAAGTEILNAVTDRIAASYPHMTRAELEQRAHKKSEWAYQELKALLTIARNQSIDALSIRGSWAGAFGMPQFLPSSYAQFARDGNDDGKVSLHDRYDAMTSVANYLRSHGWTRGAPETHKKAVIRKYNNSGAYTEAVLQLARLVKEKE